MTESQSSIKTKMSSLYVNLTCMDLLQLLITMLQLFTSDFTLYSDEFCYRYSLLFLQCTQIEPIQSKTFKSRRNHMKPSRWWLFGKDMCWPEKALFSPLNSTDWLNQIQNRIGQLLNRHETSLRILIQGIYFIRISLIRGLPEQVKSNPTTALQVYFL